MKKFLSIVCSLVMLVAIAAPAAFAASAGYADEYESSVTGYIDSIDEQGVCIVTPEGKSLYFLLDPELDMFVTNGLAIADTVRIYYYGTLNGTDTTYATVTKVSEVTYSSPTVTRSISGVAVDYTMGALYIQTKDGRKLGFQVAQDPAMAPYSIPNYKMGDTLKIAYTGIINGSDTSEATATGIFITSHSGTDNGYYHSITGIIHDASMNSIGLTADDGRSLVFALNDNTNKTGSLGLKTGNKLTVYFTGEIYGTDTSAVTVTKIVEKAVKHTASTPVNAVSGTISKLTSKSFNFTTNGGAILTFYMATTGMYNGERVVIYYTGNLSGTQSSTIHVTQITPA